MSSGDEQDGATVDTDKPAKRKRQASASAASSEKETSQAELISEQQNVALFIERRTALHEVYIRETQKTRRQTQYLAAALLALACLVPVFAPQGRETVSYLVGTSLLVFALGAGGYSTFKMRLRRDGRFDLSADS